MDMSFFTGDGFLAFLKSMAFGGCLGLLALVRQKEMERKEGGPEDLLFWPKQENIALVETAFAPAWSYGPDENALLERLEAAVRKQERLEASLRRVAKTARKRALNKRKHPLRRARLAMLASRGLTQSDMAKALRTSASYVCVLCAIYGIRTVGMLKAEERLRKKEDGGGHDCHC